MRIVFVSDTHGLHNRVEGLPDGEVLVHAGDFMNSGRDPEDIWSFNRWLGEQPFKHRIVCAGNHDRYFETAPQQARNLLTNAIYLENNGVTIDNSIQEMLYAWHKMVRLGPRDLADVGHYRTSEEPMQIVSVRIGASKVHFEAPPSERVPSEMNRFVAWFNQTAPGCEEFLPAITRAGIAHIYFESIHPFEDGNGRIGRAIAEKAAAQAVGQPIFLALATAILANQKGYYEALERANRRIDITEWLTWFAEIAVEAQRRSIARVEFVIAKTKLVDRLRGVINARQEKVLLRMFQEGPDCFKGGLSAGNYMNITGSSPATTTRDLADLVERGALVRTGELKHARYTLKLPVPGNGYHLHRQGCTC